MFEATMSDAKRSRICRAVVGVLVVVVAAISYRFIVGGSAKMGEDGRVAVELEPGERAFVLQEMRDFVGGLQLIADGLSRDDMKSVARAARAMGMATARDAPLALMGRLPLEFKTLGFGVHRDFDRMASDAVDGENSKHTLAQLSDILQKCDACHRSFQIRAVTTR